MTITPQSTVVAKNCAACTWVSNATATIGNAITTVAAKVSHAVATAFRAVGHYTALAFAHVKNAGAAVLNAMKAHPHAVGGAVALLAIAATVYAYNNRAPTVAVIHAHV